MGYIVLQYGMGYRWDMEFACSDFVIHVGFGLKKRTGLCFEAQ